MGYILFMQTVVELPQFTNAASSLFTTEECEALVSFIALNPFAGDEIPGTGGVRKLRFGAKSKGKRGGSRVVYFAFDEQNPIYLLTCYGKNEKDDLSPTQKKAMKAFTVAMKAQFRKGK